MSNIWIKQDHMVMIQRIYVGFKTTYAGKFQTEIENKSDCVSLIVKQGGYPVSRYDFYGSTNGSLSTIKIYGQQLQGHYNTISSSRKCFALPVRSISLERDHVNIVLQDLTGLR